MTELAPAAVELSKVGALDRFLDRASDWANPILVKDVRQALRGRFFRLAFSVVLLALCLVTTTYIMEASTSLGNRDGRNLFNAVYGWLGAALFALVPFGTFSSMGNEWDENTFDLLVLSTLKPWRIIWGKLLSAGVQALLYLVTFAPFLACAFIMQGVDLGALAVVLIGSFLWSMALSIMALALSTMSKTRIARIFLMAVLTGTLVFATAQAIAMGFMVMKMPDSLSGVTFSIASSAVLVGLIYVAAFLFCVASNSLAHPEENHSTNLRVVCSLGFLAGMIWLSYATYRSPDAAGLTIGCFFLLYGCLVVPSMLFITEPDPMGRRVAFRAPRGPLSSLVSMPWLPGGGRGVLFLGLHVGLLVMFYLVLSSLFLRSGPTTIADEGAFSFLGTILYLAGYMLIPVGLLSSALHRLPVRIMARLGAPLLFLFLLFLPALGAFLFGGSDQLTMRHVGNPWFFMSDQWDGFDNGGWWLAIGLFAGLGVLINLPRVVRGYLEVGQVRAAQLERK